MKAIRTTYHGPGNVRGARIIASDEDGNRVTVSYNHALSSEDAHREAAEALCRKMAWDGALIAGALGHGYVFVFAETAFARTVADELGRYLNADGSWRQPTAAALRLLYDAARKAAAA